MTGCDRESSKPNALTTPTPETRKSDAGAQVERLLNAGSVAEANKLVDTLADGEPESNWEFWRMAARTKLLSGNPQLALTYAERTLAVQPRDSETKVVLGTALARTGQAAKGEKILSEMASRFSREISFQCQLAEARMLAGKLPEADRAARDAVRLCPDDVNQAPLIGRAYTTLGMVLNAQQRYPEAIAVLRQSIEFYPNSAVTYSALSVALARTGNADEARTAAEKAVALSPDNAMASANLGALLVEQKQWPKAVAALEKAVQLDPKLRTAWLNLAIAAKQTGNAARAQAAEQTAKSLPP